MNFTSAIHATPCCKPLVLKIGPQGTVRWVPTSSWNPKRADLLLACAHALRSTAREPDPTIRTCAGVQSVTVGIRCASSRARSQARRRRGGGSSRPRPRVDAGSGFAASPSVVGSRAQTGAGWAPARRRLASEPGRGRQRVYPPRATGAGRAEPGGGPDCGVAGSRSTRRWRSTGRRFQEPALPLHHGGVLRTQGTDAPSPHSRTPVLSVNRLVAACQRERCTGFPHGVEDARLGQPAHHPIPPSVDRAPPRP